MCVDIEEDGETGAQCRVQKEVGKKELGMTERAKSMEEDEDVRRKNKKR